MQHLRLQIAHALDLKCHLQLSQNVPTVKVMATSMLAALDQRFAKLLNCATEGFDPLAAAACYVDPSVSAILGAPSLPGLLAAARTFIFNQCLSLSSESAHPSSSSQSTPTSSGVGTSTSVNVESVEPPLKRFKFLQQQLSISHSQSTSVGVGPETELANYSAELCSATVINCSATEFWQGREAGYPLLSKIALDLISAPASQAYTERVFSVCGDLTAGKRNRMTRGLERRVFLRLNLKYV